MRILVNLFAAVAPLLITLLLAWLVMEDHLSLGGGEKDLILAVPLLFWSLIYLFCYAVLWLRRSAIRRAIAVSAGLATGVLAIASIVLLGFAWRGF